MREQHGGFVKPCCCKGGVVDCGYVVVNPLAGCPYDCAYCILQEYLDTDAITVYSNTADMLAEVERFVSASPDKKFRIGTGELGDSLAMERESGAAGALSALFAGLPNAVLELKTKGADISALKKMKPAGRTVVSWSVNTEEVISANESGTAPLVKRLDAAAAAASMGFKVGFHLDPIVAGEDAEKKYAMLCARLFNAVRPGDVAWIGMGVLRYTRALKRVVLARRPQSAVMCGEDVLCADGKFRPLRTVRVKLYRAVAAELGRCAPAVPWFLCMEPPRVWKEAAGRVPDREELNDRLYRSAVGLSVMPFSVRSCA